jgi:hypothetical protein
MNQITLNNLDDDFVLDDDKQKIYNLSILSGTTSPMTNPPVEEKNWIWINTSLKKITHYWNGFNLIYSKLSATITTSILFPNVDVVFFGNNGDNLTGTIKTSSMLIGQCITIKRSVNSTGILTLQSESGLIENINNTLDSTTILSVGSNYGQCVDFMWDGTNLLRVF